MPDVHTREGLRDILLELIVGAAGGDGAKWRKALGEVEKLPIAFNAESNLAGHTTGTKAKSNLIGKRGTVASGPHEQRRALKGYFMLLALALAAASTASTATYTAAGKWTLDYQQDVCMLTRSYSAGGATVSLGFRQSPGDYQTEVIVLFTDHPDDRTRRSTVVMGTGATSKTVEPSVSYRLPGERKRLLRFLARRDAVAALATQPTLTLDEARQSSITFAINKPDGPLRALTSCEQDQMRSWGVDVSQVAVPAKRLGDFAKWLVFPLEASMNNQDGDTKVRWKINTLGAVTDCVIVRSSGNAVLDASACKQITKNGHYTPAIGKDGKPMPWLDTRQIIWSLKCPDTPGGCAKY